jgi:hypothetical protein
MRYTFCLALLFLAGVSLFGQQTTVAQLSLKEQYLRKSKNKKRTGWILLGTGVALMGSGTIFAVENQSGYAPLLGIAVAGAGLGLSIGSVFPFLAAGRYKRKATTLSFHLEKAIEPFPRSFGQTSFPAVKLKITL